VGGGGERRSAPARAGERRANGQQPHENHEARFKDIPYGRGSASRMIRWTIDFDDHTSL
jgi:hypothetical protein